MEEKRVKSGRKNLHQIFAVSILTLFLASGICTEWIQTDTFISYVENIVSFSETEDVLSIAEPKQSLLGDVCTIEHSFLHTKAGWKEGSFRLKSRKFYKVKM